MQSRNLAALYRRAARSRTCPVCASTSRATSSLRHLVTVHIPSFLWPASRSLGVSSRRRRALKSRRSNGCFFRCGQWQCAFTSSSMAILKYHCSSHSDVARCLSHSPSKRRSHLLSPSTRAHDDSHSVEEFACRLEVYPDTPVEDLTARNTFNMKHHVGNQPIDAATSSLIRKRCLKDWRRIKSENGSERKSVNPFLDIPSHMAPSGLFAIPRNTDAKLCLHCWVVQDVAMEDHTCTAQNPDSPPLTALVQVRNESNLPHSLGNGYRRPLFKSIDVPHPVNCTACNQTISDRSALHVHMIECSNRMISAQMAATQQQSAQKARLCKLNDKARGVPQGSAEKSNVRHSYGTRRALTAERSREHTPEV